MKAASKPKEWERVFALVFVTSTWLPTRQIALDAGLKVPRARLALKALAVDGLIQTDQSGTLFRTP